MLENGSYCSSQIYLVLKPASSRFVEKDHLHSTPSSPTHPCVTHHCSFLLANTLLCHTPVLLANTLLCHTPVLLPPRQHSDVSHTSPLIANTSHQSSSTLRCVTHRSSSLALLAITLLCHTPLLPPRQHSAVVHTTSPHHSSLLANTPLWYTPLLPPRQHSLLYTRVS